MSAFLDIRNLEIFRQKHKVLSVSQLLVERGEVLAVIGPNGAGKSTLLLALSRLLPVDRGEIFMDGQSVQQINPLAFRRKLGLVLQDPLLLDHTVFENVATGLRFRGEAQRIVRQRVDAWLERLAIQHLRDRPAHRLSGGEAQRVSLARAFVLEPELLLLDEPFSALDAPTRIRLVDDIQALLQTTHTTTVFITHDLDEALRLGQRVAVLIGGQLRQVGQPQSVFSAPADPDVAAFVGVEMVIPAEVRSGQDGMLTVRTSAGSDLTLIGDAAPGQAVYVCLRPEDITLWPEDDIPLSSARNTLHGAIQRILPQGALLRVVIDCGFPVTALVTRLSAQELSLVEGKRVSASFKASAVHLIKRQ